MPYLDTYASIVVDSKRMGNQYKISAFSDYKVDIDLETDTDGFSFTFPNPGGKYTGLISKFDKVNIRLCGHDAIRGEIDSVETAWSTQGSVINVTGRDNAHILVDNDALPATKLNVNPVSYARGVCNSCGIPFHSSFTSLPSMKELIIGCSESEINIINNLIVDTDHKLYYIYDTLYMGDWNTGSKPQYYFTHGVPDNIRGIPIETLSIVDDGTSMKSEIKLYGSMNDGKDKVVGTANNPYMINNGIKRRQVKWSSNNDISAKYSSSALKDIKNSFKNNVVLQIRIKTLPNVLIYPNFTAQVIDTITKINSVFFIKSVTYEKSTSGSFTTVKMLPGDSTFNVLWSGQGTKDNGCITGMPSTTNWQVISKTK